MIKNIILDMGGVIFDDSKENINRVLKTEDSHIYKKSYGENFRKTLIGEMSISDVIDSFKDDSDYDSIKYILSNLDVSLPLIKENYNYICALKNKGYKLYLLSNINKETHEYIKEKIDIDNIFNGGIYSYQEKLVKPDIKIFELIVNRYNLNKEETIFFDDKERNIIAGNNYGIRSFVFKNIDDIERELCND